MEMKLTHHRCLAKAFGTLALREVVRIDQIWVREDAYGFPDKALIERGCSRFSRFRPDRSASHGRDRLRRKAAALDTRSESHRVARMPRSEPHRLDMSKPDL